MVLAEGVTAGWTGRAVCEVDAGIVGGSNLRHR